MQVFLGWSGVRSQSVAQVLHDWLPFVIPGVASWMPAASTAPSARWNAEIGGRLEDTQVGILCLTRESMMAPWILFEAGALAQSIPNACIYTYLLDMDPVDVQGPLAQFKAVAAEKTPTWELVRAMYSALGAPRLPEVTLHTIFDKFWPDLEASLHRIPGDAAVKTRSHRSLLEEILANVRSLSRMSYTLIEQGKPPFSASAQAHWLAMEGHDASALDDESDLVAWVFDEEEDAAEEAEGGIADEVIGLEEAHKPVPLLAGLSKPRMLVVEDNENTQFLIQSLLEENVEITVVATAEEALLEAFRTEYEMVVVDINLGEGPNGMDLLSELRAMPTYREIPIVAITAYALPGDKERFLEMGFTDYLAKPFHADDLLALMVRL
jgi:CheY-like chemotaxis protein